MDDIISFLGKIIISMFYTTTNTVVCKTNVYTVLICYYFSQEEYIDHDKMSQSNACNNQLFNYIFFKFRLYQ